MALLCECEHIKHSDSGHNEAVPACRSVKTTFGTFLLCKECAEDCYSPENLKRVLIVPPRPQTVVMTFTAVDIDYTKIADGEEPICQWCQECDADLEYRLDDRPILTICRACHELMANPQ